MSSILTMLNTERGQCIQIRKGDITMEDAGNFIIYRLLIDELVIVNAANEMLAHGGGVAGAIRRAGGPSIQRESSEWVRCHGPVREGSAAWTGGGDMMAPIVIHAVGPVWRDGRNDEVLRFC